MSSYSGTSITFDYINGTVNQALSGKERTVKGILSEMGDSPTTQDLLVLQQQVQQYTLFTEIQSTLVKEVGDSMKGVVQKSG